MVRNLEYDPGKVQFSLGQLERMIAWCMDAIYQLAKQGDDDEHKMKLVALEYRARLVLERSKKLRVN